MTSSAFGKQIQNRNFLSPVGFKFTLAKYPKVDFFSNSARIPELSLGTAIEPSYLKDIDIPGEKLTYGDLTIRFIVDEDLRNYMEIHNWIRALGVPDNVAERQTWINANSDIITQDPKVSDGTLQVLNNNNITNFDVVFKDMFPTNLSTLDFNVTQTDNEFLTASVTFKYLLYEIRNVNTQTRR